MINYKDRTYGKTKNFSISELENLFQNSKFNYLHVILLFGSRAKYEATRQSDYDFAIYGDASNAPFGIQAKSWIDISMAMDVSEYDIDVINLIDIDSLMKESIKEKYIILKGDKSEVSRLLN